MIRFATKSQNRNYRVQLARRETGPQMLVEYLGTSAYRRDADLRFALLEKQYEEIASKSTQESFEAALLSHYEKLSGQLGADHLSSRLMGQTPTSYPWWSIMTGWEYTSRHDLQTFAQVVAGLRRLREPVRGEGEEANRRFVLGRLQEAYEEIVKAESLITKEHHPRMLAHIREDKARLLKLKGAERLPGGLRS